MTENNLSENDLSITGNLNITGNTEEQNIFSFSNYLRQPRPENFRHRIENILFLINRYNNIRDMEDFEEEIEENNSNYYYRRRMNEYPRDSYRRDKYLEPSLIPILKSKVIKFNQKEYSYYHLCKLNLNFTNKYKIILNLDFTAKKVLLKTKYIVRLNILDKEIICNNIECDKNFCNGKIHLGSKQRKLLIKIEEETIEKLMEELESKIQDFKYCIECNNLWDIKSNERYHNTEVNYDVKEEVIEDFDICDNCIIQSSLNNKTLKVIDSCSICLKTIYENNFTKTLCKHIFHKHCISTWLEKKNSCPLCRFRLKNIHNHILIEEL